MGIKTKVLKPIKRKFLRYSEIKSSSKNLVSVSSDINYDEFIAFTESIKIRRVGFGTGWRQNVSEFQAIKILSKVLECGINLIDTADCYGPHDGPDSLKPIASGPSCGPSLQTVMAHMMVQTQ